MWSSVNGYEFDMNRMCSFEGDTGPYLQYAHARLSSIIRKSKAADPEWELPAIDNIDLALLIDKAETEVARKVASNLIHVLTQWPDMFVQTLKTLEPVTVLTYLFKMTHALNSSYDHLIVVSAEKETRAARLLLYVCARQVLGNGMRLLGLSPLER